MYSTEHYSSHSNGNGYLGSYARTSMSPTRNPLPYYRSYHNGPRREENWSRNEHIGRPIYSESHQGIPGMSRTSVIPQRFEHRMDQEGMDRVPVSSWRPQQERSVTLQDTEPRERVVYRPKHLNLKTSDLSHRLGIPHRSCKQSLLPNESPPRSVHVMSSQRSDRKVSAKERLTLRPRPEKRPEQTVKKKTSISPTKPAKRLASHVRSATQNDPRIKSDSGESSPPPLELKVTTPRRSIGQFLGRVREYLDPESHFFDEDSSHKEDTTTHSYQANFDVPLPPSTPLTNPPPSSNVENTKKSVEHTKDSFWDETDDIPTDSLPLLFTQTTPKVPTPSPQAEAVASRSQPSISTLTVRTSNNNNKAPFFDEEFAQTVNNNNNTQTNAIEKKNSHHHNKNIVKHRRRNESKSKRHSRPSESTRHSKHSHKSSHSHAPSKPTNKYNHKSPRGLLANSNSPLLTIKAATHIRLKKTVNLADHEPIHTSSEDESQELAVIAPKLDIPLPSAPLPLSLISSPELLPISLPPGDLSSDFTGQIDFNLLSQEFGASSSQTLDDTAIGLAVEVSQTYTDTHDTTLHITPHKKRQPTCGNTDEITIQIEYVSDDVTHKSPHHNKAKPLIASPPRAELPPLPIEEFKPISPKFDAETRDSVFTQGFNPSTSSPCVVSSADSPILSIDFSDTNCSKRLKFTNKDKLDLNAFTRKPGRKPKNARPESDHSFSNTREVCIPLTKLDVTQYGGKVKATSEPPLEKLAAKERQIIKVFSQWKCMFCHKGANESNLGYLFGPYFKTGENLKMNPLPINARRKASKELDENELWVHAPCALWTPGVLMVSFHLSGLIDAYDGSLSNTCTECGNSGATLSCEVEDCTNTYHYTCAESIPCNLNHESFKLHCPVHNKHHIDT